MTYVTHVFERDESRRAYSCTPPDVLRPRGGAYCDGCRLEVTDRELHELTPERYALATLRPTNIGMSLLAYEGVLGREVN